MALGPFFLSKVDTTLKNVRVIWILCLILIIFCCFVLKITDFFFQHLVFSYFFISRYSFHNVVWIRLSFKKTLLTPSVTHVLNNIDVITVTIFLSENSNIWVNFNWLIFFFFILGLVWLIVSIPGDFVINYMILWILSHGALDIFVFLKIFLRSIFFFSCLKTVWFFQVLILRFTRQYQISAQCRT